MTEKFFSDQGEKSWGDSTDQSQLTREMYQEHILELYRKPKWFGTIQQVTHASESANHMCGDVMSIQLRVADGIVREARFNGKGCALMTAAASIVMDHIHNMSVRDVMALKQECVVNWLGISVSPTRAKCVMLPLETVWRALNGIT